jgi:hypothetical protein
MRFRSQRRHVPLGDEQAHQLLSGGVVAGVSSSAKLLGIAGLEDVVG